jgi:glycosyltransferase involved in cell wall biosynthesis
MVIDVAEIEKRVNDSYELPNSVIAVVQQPLVTVRTSTYQHGAFIRQCIEGVLMQKTTFPFEFIIGEDFSTDGTRQIVFEYAQRYPDIIRVITADYNVGMRANGIRCIRRARGKYIAQCEGDDYWTDPYKLQKQVDFLEQNHDYGLVHADCDIHYIESGRVLNAANRSLGIANAYTNQEDLFDQLIEGGYTIRTATVLHLRSVYDTVQENFEKEISKFLMGDTPLWLEMSRLIKFHYMDEVVAVYRRLPESASKSQDEKKRLRFQLSSFEARVHYMEKYRGDVSYRVRRAYNRSLIMYKTVNPDYEAIYPLIQPNVIEVLFYGHPYAPVLKWLLRLYNRLSQIKGLGFPAIKALLISRAAHWVKKVHVEAG